MNNVLEDSCKCWVSRLFERVDTRQFLLYLKSIKRSDENQVVQKTTFPCYYRWKSSRTKTTFIVIIYIYHPPVTLMTTRPAFAPLSWRSLASWISLTSYVLSIGTEWISPDFIHSPTNSRSARLQFTMSDLDRLPVILATHEQGGYTVMFGTVETNVPPFLSA